MIHLHSHKKAHPTPSTLHEAWRQVLPYTHLGWQLFVTVLLFVCIGWGVDELTGLTPIGIVMFSIIGIGIGLYSMMTAAQELSRKQKNN